MEAEPIMQRKYALEIFQHLLKAMMIAAVKIYQDSKTECKAAKNQSKSLFWGCHP